MSPQSLRSDINTGNRPLCRCIIPKTLSLRFSRMLKLKHPCRGTSFPIRGRKERKCMGTAGRKIKGIAFSLQCLCRGHCLNIRLHVRDKPLVYEPYIFPLLIFQQRADWRCAIIFRASHAVGKRSIIIINK